VDSLPLTQKFYLNPIWPGRIENYIYLNLNCFGLKPTPLSENRQTDAEFGYNRILNKRYLQNTGRLQRCAAEEPAMTMPEAHLSAWWLNRMVQ